MPENPRLAPPGNRVAIDSPVLLSFGPGFPIFGHWLLDFLPRVAIAKELLGDGFSSLTILLPDDTPEWVSEMLRFFCGVPGSQIRRFSRRDDVLACSRVCLPSFAHDGDYALHGFLHEFYHAFRSPQGSRAKQRICLTRRAFEKSTRSAWRVFEGREAFERIAVQHGYQIVQPELLGFAEQIDLFRTADVIIGEHGSGMHAALFADPGAIVATFPPLNAIQLRIGAEFDHTNVLLQRAVIRQDPDRVVRFTVDEDDLRGMLTMIDLVRLRSLPPARL